MLGADFAKPRRTRLFRRLDQRDRVETERAARCQHSLEREHDDGMLALVVGGPTTIDALALDLHLPGVAAVRPGTFHSRDDIAMAIDEKRRQCVGFDAPRDQQRTAGGVRIFDHFTGKAEPTEIGTDFIEIAIAFGTALGLLAFRGYGNTTLQVGQETAVGGKGRGKGDGLVPRHNPAHSNS